MLTPQSFKGLINRASESITNHLGYVKAQVEFTLSKQPSWIQEINWGADILLQNDGIVVLPGFFSIEQINRMVASIPGEQYTSTPEMQHSVTNPLADKFIPDANTIPWLETFFQNPEIASIVRSYFSETAVPGRNFVRTKKDTWPVASFENFYHFDSIKNRVKVFLYLWEVGRDNAPVAYLKWTHKTWLWRVRKEVEMYVGYRKDEQWYAKDDTASYIGCYWPHEVEELIKKHWFTEEIVTWPAGTVIIFDAKWLHKATQLVEGERSILMSHWFIPNHHT